MSEQPEKPVPQPDNDAEELANAEQLANSEELANHRVRMRTDWDNLIDDLIQDGFEQGAFDNLRGKGKPLALNRNPYERDRELSNAIMKEHKLRPVWITQRATIIETTALLRDEIRHQWTRHQRAWDLAQGDAQRSGLTISWDDHCLAWEAQIVKLNKQIDEFNLRRPMDNLELFKLRFDEELARVGAPRWLR